MEDVAVAIISVLLVVALIPLYLWKRRQVPQSHDEHEEQAQVQQGEAVVRATSSRRMRRRPASAASTSSSRPVEGTENGSDEEEAVEGEYYNAKKSKKKEERQAQRQAEEASRESRQTKQDRYAEMRRKKDEEYEAKERMLEEEAKARKAKEEEAAALEFEKWKDEFSVDAEGTTENEVQDENQDLLFDFVEYIKKHKCVPLEDLAAEFKLRTQECINQITSMEDLGDYLVSWMIEESIYIFHGSKCRLLLIISSVKGGSAFHISQVSPTNS